MTTEQAILSAAEKLFLERGYALTTTTEIARVAGCNQPTVHYYFRTKERLFEAIFESKAALFLSTFEAIHQQSLPFDERVRRYVEAHFDLLVEHPQMPFLIVNELLLNPARIDSVKKKLAPSLGRFVMQLMMQLQDEVDAGTVRPLSIVDLLFSIVSLNAAVFLGGPVLRNTVLSDEEEWKAFLERRKAENVRLVLSCLRP